MIPAATTSEGFTSDFPAPPERGPRSPRTIVLGVVVAPGLAHELTADLIADLQIGLNERFGSVEWEPELTVDRLVPPSAAAGAILEAARQKLLESRWDLGIVVTDLPLHVGTRPISRQVSRTHGVAIVSLPALGAINLRHRLLETLIDLVGELIGAPREQSGAARRTRLGLLWHRGVLRELATTTLERPGRLRVLFIPSVVVGNVRLLIGMVRDNRPWRFAARLYRALIAALGVGVFSLVVADDWRIATAMGWGRLAVATFVAIATTTVSIIVVHALWERAPDPRARAQVVLFNVATGATIVIGILALYLVLFLLTLSLAWLIVRPGVLEHALGRDVGAADYVALVWFVTSLGMFGGALGAALESDEAVRHAAYASTTADDSNAERTRRAAAE